MSDQSQQPNGAAHEDIEERTQSLREIAESAYETVVNQPDDEGEIDSGQPRDERGRWIPKSQEGEAEAKPPSPSETTQETQQEHPAPAQPGQAAQPPSNWSAEDRANFEKLPQEGKEFLLRRHSEMEGDYQRRVQAAAMSNQFVQAIAPVFEDPAIAESLQRDRRTPIEAVYQWAGFHRRAMDPDPQNRITLLFELADRMQLDPAAVFGRQQARQAMSFTSEELANPAFRKFADHIGLLNSKLQANEAALQEFNRSQQEAIVGARRAEIDAFAATRNADGSPAYPYFDAVLPIIMDVYRADPTKTIEQCYQTAVEPFLKDMQSKAQASVEQKQNLARAQNAVRGNVRGTTAPVAKPPPPGGRRSLRATLDESAEEVGFEG